MSTDDTRVEDIKAREQAATAGPWLDAGGEFVSQSDTYMAICRVNRPVLKDIVAGKTVLAPRGAEQANKDFIAHAREDIPYLLAQLAAKEETLAAIWRMRDGYKTWAATPTELVVILRALDLIREGSK